MATTYAQAHTAILALLMAKGWEVKQNLKIPHATSPDGNLRLWFKAQAIYYGTNSNVKDFGSAHSLWASDLRTMTAENLQASLHMPHLMHLS